MIVIIIIIMHQPPPTTSAATAVADTAGITRHRLGTFDSPKGWDTS
jgi:hypothetical protein